LPKTQRTRRTEILTAPLFLSIIPNTLPTKDLRIDGFDGSVVVLSAWLSSPEAVK